MESSLLNKIEEYWTTRAPGYSEVNQEELDGCQRENWTKLLMQQIRKKYPDRTPEEIRVLDIGTGPGFFAIILAQQGYQVTAVDYTAGMLKQAKKNAGDLVFRIDFRQMDAQDLQLEDEDFDVIVTRNLTWNLEKPWKAYKSWCRVLRPGGLLLNFDANWYGYLFDEEKKAEYERDRINVASQGIEDHYTCTDIDTMEEIAMQVPLSNTHRPGWDVEVLHDVGMEHISVTEDIGSRVWSEIEKINYAATPMFMVSAVKGEQA